MIKILKFHEIQSSHVDYLILFQINANFKEKFVLSILFQ